MAVQLRWSLNKAELASHEGYSYLYQKGLRKEGLLVFYV